MRSALVAGLLVAPGCGGDARTDGPAPDGEAWIAEDPRLAWLLEPFPRSDHYDVDTTDVLGILVECLRHGHRDPLHHARLELAQEGPAGVEALGRVVEAAWADPARTNDIRNALGSLAHSSEPAARELITRVLDHPAPACRQAAWQALRSNPDPRDYDGIRERLAFEDPIHRRDLARLLHLLDPPRAEEEFVAWIEEERELDLWPEVAQLVAASPLATVQGRACSLWRPREEAPLRAALAGACAASGDPESLAELVTAQRGDKPALRALGLESLIAARRWEEVAWSLERDPAPSQRLQAARALIASGSIERFRSQLLLAMGDADKEVAGSVMALLAAQGEERAIDLALSRLDGIDPPLFESAVRVLAPLWSGDPALARRGWELLLRLDEEQRTWPLPERAGTLRAIGTLGLPESCLHLLELVPGASGVIQGARAERWLVLQIANGGAVGLQLLASELERSQSLRRRIDLIEGIAAQASEAAREHLLERLEREGLDPYEVLYLADRLTRMGPARRVAPVLKRAILRVQRDDARRALQGLAWYWYPAP